MITQYETIIDHWEEWQQEYRFGVILIFPPEPLLTQVNTLRATHDPRSQATCDAHISLTLPLPRPISEAHWMELDLLIAEVEPFTIQYGPLRHYMPYPGVCLNIEPQEILSDLVRRLENTAVFAGAPSRRYPFSAHMTIAEFISADQTMQLMDELAESAPIGSFTCIGLSYAVPDSQFHFSERKGLPLGAKT